MGLKVLWWLNLVSICAQLKFKTKTGVPEWVSNFNEIRDLSDFDQKSGKLNGAVSKTVVLLTRDRGFESHPSAITS